MEEIQKCMNIIDNIRTILEISKVFITEKQVLVHRLW